MENLKKLANHLEFLGYELELDKENERYRATHDKNWNFMFGNSVGGILLRCYIGTEDDATMDKLLKYVNDLNREAAVARFYIDDDGDFTFEGWWPREYNKATFGVFMDAWHHDGALMAKREESRELLA